MTDLFEVDGTRPECLSPHQLLELAGCQLTTPHKLQGGGSVGKPIPGTAWLYQPPRKPMAAP
jgi:hypothetical protein